ISYEKRNLTFVAKEISSQVYLKIDKASEINKFNATVFKTYTELKIDKEQITALLTQELADNTDLSGLYILQESNHPNDTNKFTTYVVKPASSPISVSLNKEITDLYLFIKAT